MNCLKNLVLLISFTIFANVASAQIPGTAWSGSSELFLNGKIFCSVDSNKKPVVQISQYDNHWLSIHEGRLGWIWPNVSGGCALGWLTGYMQLRAVGADLFDEAGLKVGSITSTKISAQNFIGTDKNIRILNLEIEKTSDTTVTVNIKFQHGDKPGVFEYVGQFKRWHDSNWP